MVIGMPPRPAPLLTKTPIKKNHLRASRVKVFPSEERNVVRASSLRTHKQGKVLRADSAHARAVFRLTGHNIAPGAEMQDEKLFGSAWKCARGCLICARGCFILCP